MNLELKTPTPTPDVDSHQRPQRMVASPVNQSVGSHSHDNDDSPKATRASTTSGRCGLVQCRKSNCNLQSHRYFVAARRRAVRQRRQWDTERPALATPRHQPTDDVLTRSVARVESQISEALPQLKHDSSAALRQLVHHYFTVQVDRLIQMFFPYLDRRIYKTTMMQHALSNDVFCLCITANAKTNLLMLRHTSVPDRASELVYAVTVHMLRQKLDKFKRTDADWLLVLVVALVGFDLAFGRMNNLKSHHEALKQLVIMKGGVHTLGHTGVYITNTDRMLAVFTGALPHFLQSPILPHLTEPPLQASAYGLVFKRLDLTRHIDHEVLDFCLSQCKLIHLAETARISMDPGDPPSIYPSVIPYFLYWRDRTYCEETRLYAMYHENQNPTETVVSRDNTSNRPRASRTLGKSRCVLLAAMIVEYHVLQSNYYPVKKAFLADQLKSILELQPPSEWSLREDMLIWILFVLAVIPEEWNHHQWAIQKLKQKLDARFRGRLARNEWKGKVLQILKEHVWSERLQSSFEKVYKHVVVGGRGKVSK